MATAVEKVPASDIIDSIDEIDAELKKVEYATIAGFTPGRTLRIGSLTAGDLIEWAEASEGEAKRTAGLRLICKSLVGPEPENRRYANSDDKATLALNVAKFRAMRHNKTEEIVQSILKLNGMKPKAEAEAKNS